jgi:hypothetical protein
LNRLKQIRELKPAVVIPGHSEVGPPLDVSTAVDFTEKYLLMFEEEFKKAKGPDSLINTMKERFPSAEFLLAIERARKLMLNPDKQTGDLVDRAFVVGCEGANPSPRDGCQ